MLSLDIRQLKKIFNKINTLMGQEIYMPISLINPMKRQCTQSNVPNFIHLLCLTPDDFTCQGDSLVA
jgi:hypothetical protein